MTPPYTTPDPACSALIIIDVQNDFTLPDAPSRIPGTSDIVPGIQRVLDIYRAAYRPIFHVVRLYAADGSNADLCRRGVIESGAVIVRPGTDGAEIIDDLKRDRSIRLDAETLLKGELQPVGDNEWVLYKPRWSAFYHTRLESVLAGLGVNTVVMAGCNFPNCPRSTIYDASSRDLRIVVVSDAMSGLYDKGLQELRGIGVVTMISEQVGTWLNP